MSKLGGAEEARRLLLRQRLKGNQVAEPQASVSDSPSTVPMTQMQKQIWTVQNRHPKQSAYHIVNAWRIHGDLDLKRLEEACSQVVRRHANLRNVCGVDNGEMIMATLPENNVRLDKGSTTPEELHGVVKKFANQSFDLITGPLFRIGLWQLSKDCHVLAWVFHHIIADEHSLGVIWSDLSQAYSGRPLPEADGSFYQFVLEQNEVNQNRLSFWKGFLEKSESHLSLPADMAGASKQSFSGTIQRTEVDSSVFKRVEDYCSDNRVTPANFWLSVYALVLSKHSQQEVLRIGVPSNGRQKQSHLGAVGLGLNALPVPIQCDSDESFIEFCGQVQRNSIDAIKHQPLPPQQAIGTNESGPLFQVMLVMESSPTLSLDNVTVEFVPVDLGWSKFDMTLFVNPESATLGMEFDLHLYEHSTIQRFLDDTLSLARQALGSPNEELGTLLRPNAQECAALTGLLSNPSAYAAPVPKSIAAIAKMYPHKIGVRGPSGSLSYGDLLDRGQRLAAALRTQGVQRGDCVAVLLNADKDYVVALLGIHLAAAAYVPIDPSYPETHLDHVVKDLKTNSLRRSVVVVSNSDHIGSSSLNVEWIDISELPHEGATIQEVSPSDPAYVIYTSGSTGKPKGVVISHGALANSTQSRLDYYGGSRVYLLLSSFAFDSSVAGIFWSLASGGELVVAGSEEKIDPDSIVRLVSKHEVTHTLMLSSLWELTMNRADAGQLDSLKVVIVAGDVCHPHVVAQHFSKCPSTNLYNEYGPTEATVWTSVHRCLEADQKRSVPIGKPVGHLMPLILGDDLTLLPTGAIGELCVAGSSLATEYLGREDLTRKSFVQTEFDPQPVYRTGDLARWGADGTLRFCGRKDTQLKLRG
ncbi:MAG: amino acid adenylation domain-containing protein, partial [Pseudomonadota bacterium]